MCHLHHLRFLKALRGRRRPPHRQDLVNLFTRSFEMTDSELLGPFFGLKERGDGVLFTFSGFLSASSVSLCFFLFFVFLLLRLRLRFRLLRVLLHHLLLHFHSHAFFIIHRDSLWAPCVQIPVSD